MSDFEVVAAEAAERYAYRLQNEAQRTPTTSRGLGSRTLRSPAAGMMAYSRKALEAAEAFEVAADAYEAIHDLTHADILRDRAQYNYAEAFVSRHTYLSRGFYLVTDVEARRLAKQARLKPPQPGYFIPISLSHSGPHVELHRYSLTEFERSELGRQHHRWALRRKRPWVYAILGVR